MKCVIKLSQSKIAYAAHSARAGEAAKGELTGFLSSEDGAKLTLYLEGLPTQILDILHAQRGIRIDPAAVVDMLAVIRRDGITTVLINEALRGFSARMRDGKAQGAPIHKSDIVDLEAVDVAAEIPADAGFFCVFSSGWRRGFVFDFAPLSIDPPPERVPTDRLMAAALSYVMFQERFSLTDDHWKALFNQQWFPFAGLSFDLVGKMIGHVRSGWAVDDLLEGIVEMVSTAVEAWLAQWPKAPALEPHLEILARAVERYRAKDYLSTTSLLFSRIEGILRTHLASVSPSLKATQATMPSAAVAKHVDRSACLLMPQRFEGFLQTVYFASFAPADPHITVSRNSVGHGVAAPSEYNAKAATIGLLIVHQLCWMTA